MPGKVLLVVSLILGSTAAFAQDMPGTPQEKTACRSDTRRFCISVKPQDGPFAYLACLQQHREKLSKACRAVLQSHGQ